MPAAPSVHLSKLVNLVEPSMPIELGGIDVLLGGKQAIDSSVAEDITFLERKIVVCGGLHNGCI